MFIRAVCITRSSKKTRIILGSRKEIASLARRRKNYPIKRCHDLHLTRVRNVIPDPATASGKWSNFPRNRLKANSSKRERERERETIRASSSRKGGGGREGGGGGDLEESAKRFLSCLESLSDEKTNPIARAQARDQHEGAFRVITSPTV